jgi:uncharacterized RDD family membrane protein YckC
VPEQIYATFNDRLRSGLVDGTVWIAWLLLLVFVPWPSEIPGQAKLAVWLLPPLLCEPILLIRQRASIGQRVRGLVVAAQPGREFPRFPTLLARHAVKLILGGLSVLYVPFAPRAEAIHDRLFGTVVTRAGAAQPAAPLRPDTASLRRFFLAICWVMLGYVVISIVFGIALELTYPGALDQKGDEGRAIDALLGIVLISGEVGIIYLAAKGRLPGTRLPNLGAGSGVAAQQGDEVGR